jgi:toxin ParE1/3/4
VPRVEFQLGTFEDLVRIREHLERSDAEAPNERIEAILDAITVLAENPYIGRPAKGGKRELIIGSGKHGFVALYRYAKRLDTVFVLAIRGQREARFKRRR